jgi:glycosyltransferase involved in cell wall biosynthesis
MRVSVIATVLNEETTIDRLLESLAAQSRPADEIVIADGGSTDGTLDTLNEWSSRAWLPLTLVSVPGANISAGRNAAIAAATGDVIVSTDAGVCLEPDWLAALLEPFAQPSGADRQPGSRFVAVVSGWFVADPQSLFETALGATVLPHIREVKPDTFLPSSRSVAFRRVAWEVAGGYPEWLDFCEDLVFDLRLREIYRSFPFAPRAVAHFRPRSSLPAFARQYYHYARGDGKAGLWPRRHAIRYLTYLVAAPVLVVLALLHSPWWWLALLAGALAYTATPYRRLGPMLKRYGLLHRLSAIVLVPVIRVVGDVAKMIGYPAGLLWYWKNRHRPEIHWRRPGWERERA